MFKKLTKSMAVAGLVFGTMAMFGCGNSDAPPMEKIEGQYRSIVAGRNMFRHSELHNLNITNIRCKNQGMATICTVDATGDLLVRDSLKGTINATKIDDKGIEMKFFNRDALRK